MDGCAFFERRAKYCHNGGMAFALHHAVGAPGVHDGDDGPLACPPRTGRFAGKKLRGPRSALFGGSNGLACLTATGKYCRNGAWPLAR
jgi:hypothetical protein